VEGRYALSVTAARIAKTGECVLGRCLESIAGDVDEIVVVDTGSSDSTTDIAARVTDRIFHFEWIKDFAAEASVSRDSLRLRRTVRYD
jgi:hypothetical protein